MKCVNKLKELLMSYNEYYSRLIKEFNNRRDIFPDDFNIGSHGDGNYYLTNTYKRYKIHLDYSSENSIAFGVDFIGFVVEVYLNGGNFEPKYNMLLSHREEIESSINNTLVWQSREETQSQNACRIFIKKDGNIADREHWDEYIDWQLEYLSIFISVFPRYRFNPVDAVGQNMNESNFKNWLRNTPTIQGNILDENRINGRCRRLSQTIPNKLNQVDNTNVNRSLFNVEDINNLRQIKQRLNTGGDLFEWDYNSHSHGGCSAALNSYIRFLEERGTDMTREDFVRKYNAFSETLPLQNSERYAKLFTGATNSPFKVYKNSQGSIVVKAFTNNASTMVITSNQLSRVVFDNERFLYSSYEPVLIERIKNNDFINSNEIENEITDIQDPPFPPLSSQNIIKNIILYGSPGVGKTHNTKKLIVLLESEKDEANIFNEITHNALNDGTQANQIIENIQDRVQFITFHQSFGYEDFIEGFRPDKNGAIRLQDGIFKTICDDARNDRSNKYYLVIDEINRGNISKIFGELITLIEEDKRDDLKVTLPYSKEVFSIPSNLYIIGTMNSTDKSIALIDIALRRRFTFLKMEPNSELIGYSRARELFETLNSSIKEKLGYEYQIGHSYFMHIKDDSDLEFVLKYKIEPLLEEYFYGDNEGLKEISGILRSFLSVENISNSD